MKIQIICVLLLIVLALGCICAFLLHEIDRNAKLAEQWAKRAGYAEGRITVLERAKTELIEMLRVAYIQGLEAGAR
jgi:hypothetical protein